MHTPIVRRVHPKITRSMRPRSSAFAEGYADYPQNCKAILTQRPTKTATDGRFAQKRA